MDDEEVGRYWDQNADAWTRLARAGFDVYRDELNTPAFLAMLPDVRGKRGIDLGCGEGTNTRHVAERGATMTAVDVSEKFLEAARETEAASPLGITFVRASALRLPFPPATFDFVTAFMSLMDTPEPERAITEAARVLNRAPRCSCRSP